MAADPKKNRLKPEIEIYNRLLWDQSLGFDKAHLAIIYRGRYNKLKAIPFEDWITIDNGGDIPFHRIAQFQYNNHILWDRKQRIDNINKNSGHSTLDLNQILPSQSNIRQYLDPMNTSEYIADCQFLRLLSMEPKNTAHFYQSLNSMIDNAFITQRANNIETFARHLCFQYLSHMDIFNKHQYFLFGSTKLSLNTHQSDMDIKLIPDKDTNICTRDDCIQLLTEIKNEFLKLKTFRYTLKESDTTNYKESTFVDKNIHILKNEIMANHKAIHEIRIRLSSIQIADGAIPRNVVVFDICTRSNAAAIEQFTIAMDIIVSVDRTQAEHKREQHLLQWMNKYCLKSDDKRIHKYLFSVKLWAQHFQINSSVRSTINGYGWMHIALFVLTQHYKHDANADHNKYASIYSDIDIPKHIHSGKLFVQFIDVLHSWICSDDAITQHHPKKKIVRRGINVITGEWIENIKQYALFVLDPFGSSEHLPDNLAKCVRNTKGIPLLMNAIKATVQQLQFAADESVKRNVDSISAYIAFLKQTPRNIANDNEEHKENKVEEDEDEDRIQRYSWKELCDLKLGLPQREWISLHKQKKQKQEDTVTLCQFNCLSQALTTGTDERHIFRTDAKYLKWKYRSIRILYEILQYKPDIICLCEVDAKYFESFYYLNLSQSEFKYDGVYLNKNNPNTHSTAKKKKRHVPQDGVAIFWNSFKFSCHEKEDYILGKPKKCYHVAMRVRLKYKHKEKSSQVFDVWCTHLKAGRNNKAEDWRLSQVNTLLYYMHKHSYDVPIIFCGDLNSHFAQLVNEKGEMVKARVYPALLDAEVKSKKRSNDKKEERNKLKFDSIWNDDTRNTYTTWAGWMDRDVKCCLDYIMFGNWTKHMHNDEEKSIESNESQCEKRMFETVNLLDVWDEKEIQKFDCKLPNEMYPSDHILIGAKITIKTT